MPTLRVELKPSAQRELEKLPDAMIERIVDRLEKLASDPRPKGCKKLSGADRTWRIRIGDYRVIYVVDDTRSLVSITRIRHRREVYDV